MYTCIPRPSRLRSSTAANGAQHGLQWADGSEPVKSYHSSGTYPLVTLENINLQALQKQSLINNGKAKTIDRVIIII